MVTPYELILFIVVVVAVVIAAVITVVVLAFFLFRFIQDNPENIAVRLLKLVFHNSDELIARGSLFDNNRDRTCSLRYDRRIDNRSQRRRIDNDIVESLLRFLEKLRKML